MSRNISSLLPICFLRAPSAFITSSCANTNNRLVPSIPSSPFLYPRGRGKHDQQQKSVVHQGSLSMGWADTWSDILDGGNPRWKITNGDSHRKALAHFQRYVPVTKKTNANEQSASEKEEVNVFCPLAGDDPFVNLLWRQGYSVTTIDLVPAAVEAMKSQFGCPDDEWRKEEAQQTTSTKNKNAPATTIWTHKSGRATLMIGDALRYRPEFAGKFDAVYDKDSFGAISKEMRIGFCKRMAEYTKKGSGIVYLECKLKDGHEQILDVGPPYSLKRDILMQHDNYGAHFDYVEDLGMVYDLEGMPPTIRQTGHIMRRKH